jgi:hypothetical protein
MKVGTTAEDAGVLARAIVRLAMSYVSMPPEPTTTSPPIWPA